MALKRTYHKLLVSELPYSVHTSWLLRAASIVSTGGAQVAIGTPPHWKWDKLRTE